MWNQPLINKNDSCYMDVVLNALFLDPSAAVTNALSGIPKCVPSAKICGARNSQITRMIQSKIRDVANELEIHSPGVDYYVSLEELRQSAKSCPILNGPERFDQSGMNDPSVFTEYIINIFPCLKNSGKSPLTYLETGPLKKINGMELSDVIDKQDQTFENPQLIIFDLTRLEKGKYNANVKVIPDEKLDFGTLSELTAVVVWRDYHYSVYVKVQDIWYYFDDTDEYVEEVGSYEDLLEHDDEFVSMDGKLFFYNVL